MVFCWNADGVASCKNPQEVNKRLQALWESGMKKEFKRFDMKKPPVRTNLFFRTILYVLCAPDWLSHKSVVKKYNVDGLKPPFILLGNHNAFLDFKVAIKILYPWKANYVAAIDGFIGREQLLRMIGLICKRKFTDDTVLVKHLVRIVKNGDIPVIYPEARYSLCGTTAVLPESLGKLCKLLKVPVVVLICHGHHADSPFWNLHKRKVKPVEAEFRQILDAEEVKNLSVDEINRRIVEAFRYDDFAWQKERGIRIKYKGHAEGLHKVLYQCPACNTEYRMTSSGTVLSCKACGKEWKLTELSELKALDGKTEFTHIPDWYEWERNNVRREVEEGTYSSGVLPVHVNTLPNARRFIRLGNGTMVHDMNGFRVTGTDVDGDPFEMIKTVPSMYSCHIEYEYLGKYGDCVDLNTLKDTWYVYPEPDRCDFSITKMALATEELYRAYRRAQGKKFVEGML